MKKGATKNFNLGHFLKQHHIDKALLLLDKQLKEKSFTFKTIDLEIYRKEKSLDKFDSKKYYQDYIKKDLLYNYAQFSITMNTISRKVLMELENSTLPHSIYLFFIIL